MTQGEAAQAMGVSRGGYIKLERGERGLTAAHIGRAVAVFQSTPAEVIGTSVVPDAPPDWVIDEAKLIRLLIEARERLGAIPDDEVRNLVAALISASRRPPNRR